MIIQTINNKDANSQMDDKTTRPSGRPPQTKRFDHCERTKTSQHRQELGIVASPSVSSTPTIHPITSASISSSTTPFPGFSSPPIASKTQSTGSDVVTKKIGGETRKKGAERKAKRGEERKGKVETRKLASPR